MLRSDMYGPSIHGGTLQTNHLDYTPALAWSALTGDTLEERTTLNLGCGVVPMAGAVNHDRIKHSSAVDIAWDLDLWPWPFPDGRFKRITALDVFEHLRMDISGWLAECWRILADDGELVLRVSAWDNPVSYRDPTHRRVFTEETFDFFQPGHPLYENYGLIYFPDGPWFHVVTVERGNADPRYGIGDICAVLRKVNKP